MPALVQPPYLPQPHLQGEPGALGPSACGVSHVLRQAKGGFFVHPLKQALVRIGWPTDDLCGYVDDAPFAASLRDVDADGRPFALRDYPVDAVDAFHRGGGASGGHGVVVLPCGSGKTVVGLGVIAKVASQTLVVTTNNVSASQWRSELLHKAHLAEEEVGLYTSACRQIRPVTITTYQMLTHRPSREAPMQHLALFTDYPWGLIVYDEVHMLPAPVFRATAGIQAKRRLGLTATLVREDGREDDVFALIGPKRCEVPWKVLEGRGFIAEALCTEYRLALPLITGQTPHEERERLYAAFRSGDLRTLVVSKVANFAVDLPDASVLIQVSGTYGSRQEEAQRLGRVLRPKQGQAQFCTLVSKGTEDQRFSAKRQMFLVEQGYAYRILYG